MASISLATEFSALLASGGRLQLDLPAGLVTFMIALLLLASGHAPLVWMTIPVFHALISQQSTLLTVAQLGFVAVILPLVQTQPGWHELNTDIAAFVIMSAAGCVHTLARAPKQRALMVLVSAITVAAVCASAARAHWTVAVAMAVPALHVSSMLHSAKQCWGGGGCAVDLLSSFILCTGSVLALHEIIYITDTT